MPLRSDLLDEALIVHQETSECRGFDLVLHVESDPAASLFYADNAVISTLRAISIHTDIHVLVGIAHAAIFVDIDLNRVPSRSRHVDVSIDAAIAISHDNGSAIATAISVDASFAAEQGERSQPERCIENQAGFHRSCLSKVLES